MQTKDKFKNAKGQLTKYALACGYQELLDLPKTGITTRLYQEHGCYQVRQHDHKQGKRLALEGFSTLTEARYFYNQLVRTAKFIESNYIN